MKTLNKKYFIIFGLVLFPFVATAESYTSQEGLDKIKTNVDNAKANKNEYDRNLKIVNGNIEEINKSKTTIVQQKNQVTNEILQNNDALRKTLMQEKEITTLINQEKEKIEAEKKQIEQIELVLTQLRQNQIQREALVSDYQNQLVIAQEEKKSWKAREAELRAQESKVIQSIRDLASEEAQWLKKKKGYEIEVKRWSDETDKQQRISDTYQGLKSGG